MDQATLARETLTSLGHRLHRITTILQGDEDSNTLDSKGPTANVAERLQGMENALASLESHSNAVQELLRLHNRHAKAIREVEAGRVTNIIAAPLILSHHPQYRSMASALRTIGAVPLSDASELVTVIGQDARLSRAATRASEQEQQVSRLRAESAALADRWHSVNVLSAGEAWSEWEERLLKAERSLRQKQAQERREADAI